MDEIKICVGYQYQGQDIDILPFGAYTVADCQPIFETIAGWQESTVGIQDFEKLPSNAQQYLRRIETLCGAPIAIVSTGPDREETIVLQHPFA